MNEHYKILIKGMLCDRCSIILSERFIEAGISFHSIHLGYIYLNENTRTEHIFSIEEIVKDLGFEIVEQDAFWLVNKAKYLVDKYFLEYSYQINQIKTIDYVLSQLNISIVSLNKAFILIDKISIDKFILLKRIDFIKYQLINTNYSLTDLANLCGYSSVHHLSNQFKLETGINPSQYRLNQFI